MSATLPPGTNYWVRAHLRELREIPPAEAEPLLYQDLPAEMQAVHHAMISQGVLLDHGDYELTDRGKKRRLWRVRPGVREIVETELKRRQNGRTNNGPAENPLPCDCPVFAVTGHAETIECKDCGRHFDRETREEVIPARQRGCEAVAEEVADD